MLVYFAKSPNDYYYACKHIGYGVHSPYKDFYDFDLDMTNRIRECLAMFDLELLEIVELTITERHKAIGVKFNRAEDELLFMLMTSSGIEV
jgi:hypothetical protein